MRSGEVPRDAGSACGAWYVESRESLQRRGWRASRRITATRSAVLMIGGFGAPEMGEMQAAESW